MEEKVPVLQINDIVYVLEIKKKRGYSGMFRPCSGHENSKQHA